MEFGFAVGRKQREKFTESDIGSGGFVVTSMLGLLALIIAFTYSASASRYDLRKQSVIAESNAIGTAFLRANLVAEPGKSEL